MSRNASRLSGPESAAEPRGKAAASRRARRLAPIVAGLIAASTAAVVWTWLTPDRLRAGRAAYATGDYRTALRVAQRRLKDRPDDSAAALLGARSLTGLGMTVQAEEYYRKAGDLGSTAEDLHDRAYALARGSEPDRAVALYEMILSTSPGDLRALKRLAAVHMAAKRWRRVMDLSDRLAALPGGEVEGATLAAIAHHETKHYEQAVAAASRVLELDPELTSMPLPRNLFWNNLALDLLALGRTAEAEAHLTRALSDSEDANLMELLGLASSQQGDMDRAECCWKKAVDWDPRNSNALLGLGRVALHRGRPREAIPWLDRAVETSPDALEPVYNLARAHRLLGQTAEAERLERRAAELRAIRPLTGGMGEMPEPDDPAAAIPERIR